ncbi:MAG: folylpolyglutamate synthase/dihydrofolate synthase family protein [Candidatus Omnitrophota bacterium]|nr:folylpolyglutamate synthase/dihydrofolate synthase family protein [Candidatus Omnitrophota bacterium]
MTILFFNLHFDLMNYLESLQYLGSFTNYETRSNYDYAQSFNLERMRRLASRLGNPQKDFKSIHIAGSKGKGSTSVIVHSILKEAGYKAGLYTSPHFTSFRERIRINDELISEKDLSILSGRIKNVTDRMEDDKPTFFEVYTALSYLYFSQKKIDFGVFEVGLGGSLDATNILEPLVSAITPISYEHTDKLGRTLALIAAEKAGIIKDDSVCVIAPQEAESLEVVLKICGQKRARPVLIGKDIKFKSLEWTDSIEVFTVSGLSDNYPRLEMSLLGAHQVANAATAIGVIEALRFHKIDIDKDAVRCGVEKVKWPGRLEVVSKKPYIILDGAQNRASAKALAQAIKRAFKYSDLALVLGVSKDKDIKGILDELLPIADRIILTKSKMVDRAADPQAIKEMIPQGREVYLTDNVGEAVEKAKALTAVKDLALITGSLFVVGDAREIFMAGSR